MQEKRSLASAIFICDQSSNKTTLADHLTYNLGQNKINPPPPKINDEFARKAKRAIFPLLKWGGGVVLIFHLICLRL